MWECGVRSFLLSLEWLPPSRTTHRPGRAGYCDSDSGNKKKGLKKPSCTSRVLPDGPLGRCVFPSSPAPRLSANGGAGAPATQQETEPASPKRRQHWRSARPRNLCPDCIYLECSLHLGGVACPWAILPFLTQALWASCAPITPPSRGLPQGRQTDRQQERALWKKQISTDAFLCFRRLRAWAGSRRRT